MAASLSFSISVTRSLHFALIRAVFRCLRHWTSCCNCHRHQNGRWMGLLWPSKSKPPIRYSHSFKIVQSGYVNLPELCHEWCDGLCSKPRWGLCFQHSQNSKHGEKKHIIFQKVSFASRTVHFLRRTASLA